MRARSIGGSYNGQGTSGSKAMALGPQEEKTSEACCCGKEKEIVQRTEGKEQTQRKGSDTIDAGGDHQLSHHTGVQ